jgi:hypothetical protein
MIASVRGVERPPPSIRNAAVIVLAGMAGAIAVAAPIAIVSLGTPQAARGWITAVLAVVILVSATTRERPWQFDVETPTQWLQHSAIRAAATNGLILGSGLFTRLGFWLAWILPPAMFASGPGGALLAGALYGLVRLGLSSLLATPRGSALAPTPVAARRVAGAVMYAVIAYLTVGVFYR